MRFSALACDYDGTIARKGHVDQRTLAALGRVHGSGRRLVLVTGRELDDLRAVFDQLDRFDRVVAENGGLMFDPASGETRLLTRPSDERLVARLRDRGVRPVSAGRTIIATEERNAGVVLAAIRELGLELELAFNKGAVMVLPAGVTKASGLLAALGELGLSPAAAVGVGDAENDQPFLEMCGISAAVANALPALKAEVDIVLDSDDGAGVAELVTRLLDDEAS